MNTSKVHFLFLLIFAGIGSQRSLANPMPPTVNMEISSEEDDQCDCCSSKADEVNNNDLDIENLNCQPESNHTRQQIQLIMQKLGYNVEENDLSKHQLGEAVLVLGDTGVGKSSLIQFLTRNLELQSNRTANTSHYLINDGGKNIGTTGNNYSFTQYPDVFNDNRKFFIDTPGFHGSCSPENEIISTTFLKQIMKLFKKLKILLLVDFSRGLITEHLINTLKHLDEFLDLDRFSNHIGLIVTKVPFTYKTVKVIESNGGAEYENRFHAGWRIRKSIGEELQVLENNLTNTLQSVTLSDKERVFNQKVIKFLQSFNVSVKVNGEEDPNISFSKTHLDIFQHPDTDMLGPLNNISFFESNRQALYETIKELEPVEIRQQDFKFKLSREAESLKRCLRDLKMEEYKTKLTETSCMRIDRPYETSSSTEISYYAMYNDKVDELHTLYDGLMSLGRNFDDSYYNQFLNKVRRVYCSSPKSKYDPDYFSGHGFFNLTNNIQVNIIYSYGYS